MGLFLIGIVALLASGLTLFSGFGLGTILTPAFALFIPVAVAVTAIVHFLKNIFKAGMLARSADWRIVARFGVPSMLAAVAGAALLGTVASASTVASYTISGRAFHILAVNVVVGLLIMAFAVLELSPRFQALAVPSRWLPVGGLLSGFFGGLSGNQGALRSAFLIKAGISKEAFIATGVLIAIVVDASRLLDYGTAVLDDRLPLLRGMAAPVAVAVTCAFAGSFIGRRVLGKVTLRAVRSGVAAAMLVIGFGLASGLA